MNLLADPIFPFVDDRNAAGRADLPTLFAVYSRDAVLDLPFLRPHQHAPWHSFMVQLAAIALHCGARDSIPCNAEEWRELLRGLTPKWPGDEPWRLVVPDVSKPAFMQPPVPKGASDPHKTKIGTPDDLDVLITSKNHGVKQGLAASSEASLWISALVVLQTCGDYSKAGPQFGYFGSCRRNGQYATRPFVGLVPDGGIGAHWRRDVEVMLEHRSWFFERVNEFAEESGAALLWCLNWGGERSLEFRDLDPWFIEVCRRVRLYADGQGRFTARSIGSKSARIAAKDLRGNVGDPWIPINRDNDFAAYNAQPSYRVVSEVLFEKKRWLRPLLLEWHDGIDKMPTWVRFDVTVRGQGTTEGHHRREVAIKNQKRRGFLFDDRERDSMAERAAQLVADSATLQNPVLKLPLLTLVHAGNAKVKSGDRTAGKWVQQWLEMADQRIDEAFFDQLFDLAETGDEMAWGRFLRATADAVFAAALHSLPTAGVRRLKAQAVAEEKLEGLFWKSFNGYMPKRVREAADVD